MHALRPVKLRRRLKGGAKVEADAEPLDKSFLNPIISTEPKMWKFGAVPPPYNYREGERAPIVQLGYAAFKKDGGAYFKGSFVTFVGGPDQQVLHDVLRPSTTRLGIYMPSSSHTTRPTGVFGSVGPHQGPHRRALYHHGRAQRGASSGRPAPHMPRLTSPHPTPPHLTPPHLTFQPLNLSTSLLPFCVQNWGWLATMYPNRTAKWGRCCDQPKHRLLHKFLDHPKTLMLVVSAHPAVAPEPSPSPSTPVQPLSPNITALPPPTREQVGQHTNLSHPKVITIPRGLPLTWRHTEQMVWDAQRLVQRSVKKTKLLFASASSWGPRPQILKCVSAHMPPAEFEGHVATPKVEMDKTRQDRRRYYERIARYQHV